MQRRVWGLWTVLMVFISSVPAGVVSTHATQAPAQVAAALVPIDVRVLDRAGKPVTDLKQSDFTITDDGSIRPIRSFSFENFRPLEPGTPPTASAPVVRTAMTLSPQPHRIFVFALGTGRLEEPTKSLTALIDFVRTKLLPQDQVAIFAYDRAMPFTTDHARALQVLERFRREHVDVAHEINLEFGPLSMVPLYGRSRLPGKVQAKIDAIFDGPGAKRPELGAPNEIQPEAFSTLTLDQFMFSSAQTLQDFWSLGTLMEYLRRVDGEKHVVFVTERWMDYPSPEIEARITQLASDARAALFTVQAAGMVKPISGKESEMDHLQAVAFESLRKIAETTGGVSAITERGSVAFDRIDEATRTAYRLGYQLPSSWDGTFHKVVVTVNRPGVVVLHRQGYFGVPEAGAFNRRDQVTGDRLAAAGTFRREVKDIKLKASATVKGGQMVVSATIDVSKLSLPLVGTDHVGMLNIAIFGVHNVEGMTGTDLTQGGRAMSFEPIVGAHQQTLPIKLSEEDYKRALKNGLPYTIQVPIIREAGKIRFVVYDYAADLIGRVDERIF